MPGFNAPSGAKIEMSLVDFSTGFDLVKAGLKAIRQGGIKSKIPDTIQISEMMDMDIKSISGIVDAIIDISTSKEVEDLIFKCMERCTYELKGNTDRISRDTFEPEERRRDFFPIAIEVVKYNVSPFFKDLPSLLKAVRMPASNSQPSQ